MINVDLHVHSKYSNDGEYEIQGIIDKCVKNNIDILSITDHNGIKGIDEAIPNCNHQKIELIPGIEIDCNYNGIDLHLLGYNINWRSSDFIDLYNNIETKVMDSFPEMIENLEKIGIRLDANEVLEKSKGKLPCGELIAEVLLANKVYHSNKKLAPYMEGGQRSDMPYINFYHDFFAQGRPAYVKIDYMSYFDAVDLVKSNGGVPIIAHPGVNFKSKEETINELLENGAAGVEVFNNYHDSKQVEYFADLVLKRNVLMTCGSDFHGKNKPLIDIGQYRINKKYQDYLSKSIMKLTDSSISNNK